MQLVQNKQDGVDVPAHEVDSVINESLSGFVRILTVKVGVSMRRMMTEFLLD